MSGIDSASPNTITIGVLDNIEDSQSSSFSSFTQLIGAENSSLSSQQKSAISDAVDTWSYYSAIDIEFAVDADADRTIAISSITTPDDLKGSILFTETAQIESGNNRDTINISFTNDSIEELDNAHVRGSKDFYLALSAIGKALGLKDDPLNLADYIGIDFLTAGPDLTTTGLNSYYAHESLSTFADGSYWQTPTAKEISGIQYLYGVDLEDETHETSGDTVHSWDAVTGEYMIDGAVQWTPVEDEDGQAHINMALWDVNGENDTVDFSNFDSGSNGMVISLAPGEWSYFKDSAMTPDYVEIDTGTIDLDPSDDVDFGVGDLVASGDVLGLFSWFHYIFPLLAVLMVPGNGGGDDMQDIEPGDDGGDGGDGGDGWDSADDCSVCSDYMGDVRMATQVHEIVPLRVIHGEPLESLRANFRNQQFTTNFGYYTQYPWSALDHEWILVTVRIDGQLYNFDSLDLVGQIAVPVTEGNTQELEELLRLHRDNLLTIERIEGHIPRELRNQFLEAHNVDRQIPVYRVDAEFRQITEGGITFNVFNFDTNPTTELNGDDRFAALEPAPVNHTPQSALIQYYRALLGNREFFVWNAAEPIQQNNVPQIFAGNQRFDEITNESPIRIDITYQDNNGAVFTHHLIIKPGNDNQNQQLLEILLGIDDVIDIAIAGEFPARMMPFLPPTVRAFDPDLTEVFNNDRYNLLRFPDIWYFANYALGDIPTRWETLRTFFTPTEFVLMDMEEITGTRRLEAADIPAIVEILRRNTPQDEVTGLGVTADTIIPVAPDGNVTNFPTIAYSGFNDVIRMEIAVRITENGRDIWVTGNILVLGTYRLQEILHALEQNKGQDFRIRAIYGKAGIRTDDYETVDRLLRNHNIRVYDADPDLNPARQNFRIVLDRNPTELRGEDRFFEINDFGFIPVIGPDVGEDEYVSFEELIPENIFYLIDWDNENLDRQTHLPLPPDPDDYRYLEFNNVTFRGNRIVRVQIAFNGGDGGGFAHDILIGIDDMHHALNAARYFPHVTAITVVGGLNQDVILPQAIPLTVYDYQGNIVTGNDRYIVNYDAGDTARYHFMMQQNLPTAAPVDQDGDVNMGDAPGQAGGAGQAQNIPAGQNAARRDFYGNILDGLTHYVHFPNDPLGPEGGDPRRLPAGLPAELQGIEAQPVFIHLNNTDGTRDILIVRYDDVNTVLNRLFERLVINNGGAVGGAIHTYAIDVVGGIADNLRNDQLGGIVQVYNFDGTSPSSSSSGQIQRGYDESTDPGAGWVTPPADHQAPPPVMPQYVPAAANVAERIQIRTPFYQQLLGNNIPFYLHIDDLGVDGITDLPVDIPDQLGQADRLVFIHVYQTDGTRDILIVQYEDANKVLDALARLNLNVGPQQGDNIHTTAIAVVGGLAQEPNPAIAPFLTVYDYNLNEVTGNIRFSLTLPATTHPYYRVYNDPKTYLQNNNADDEKKDDSLLALEDDYTGQTSIPVLGSVQMAYVPEGATGGQGLIENAVGTQAGDWIEGNRADNILDGRGGDDVLTGGEGADTFVYGSGYGHDVITDFNVDEDIIELDDGNYDEDDLYDAVLTSGGDPYSDQITFNFGDGDLLEVYYQEGQDPRSVRFKIHGEVYTYSDILYWDDNPVSPPEPVSAPVTGPNTPAWDGSDMLDFRNFNRGLIFDLGGQGYTSNDSHNNHAFFADTAVDDTGAAYQGTPPIENIIGTEHNDRFNGDDGDNAFWGMDGNDYFSYSKGIDWIDGGEGTDTMDFSSYGHAINVELSGGQSDAGPNLITGSADGLFYRRAEKNNGDVVSYLRNIETIWGTAHKDRLTGDMNSNYFWGLGGKDKLKGEGGNDWISGGSHIDNLDGGKGIDTVSYANSQGNVKVDLHAGTATSADKESDAYDRESWFWADNEKVKNFENIIGSAHADSLIGNALDNVIEGGDGADTIYGDGGLDTVSYASSDAGVTVNLFTATQRDIDPFASLANRIQRSGEPQVIVAGQGGHAEGDVLASIENIIGSDHSDTLGGDANSNRIEGGKGDDTINIGAYYVTEDVTNSNDPGNQTGYQTGETITYPVAGGGDVIVFSPGGGHDTIKGFNLDAGGNLVSDTSSDHDAIDISAFADAGLTATGLNDIINNANENYAANGNKIVLDFGNGDKITLEGLGNGDLSADDFILDATTGLTAVDEHELVDYTQETGVLSYKRFDQSVDVNLETGVTPEFDAPAHGVTVMDVTGSSYDDTITGNAGDNVIEGLSGADRLDGAEGNDTLSYEESDAGVAIGLGSPEPVAGRFNGGLAYASGGHASGDTIENFENVTGSAFHDWLYGNDEDNELFGLGGNDSLDGYGGDDWIEGGAGGDGMGGGTHGEFGDTLSYENSAAGVTVNLETGAASGGHAEGDAFSSFENISGSEYNDTLTGDAQDNVLMGNGEADLIVGGRGSDIIVGGEGDDALHGGAHSETDGEVDIFVHGAGDGSDTIYNFEPGTDVLYLADHYLQYNADRVENGEAQISEQDYINLIFQGSVVEERGGVLGPQTIIHIPGSSDTITLDGIGQGELDDGDFLLSLEDDETADTDLGTYDGGNNRIDFGQAQVPLTIDMAEQTVAADDGEVRRFDEVSEYGGDGWVPNVTGSAGDDRIILDGSTRNDVSGGGGANIYVIPANGYENDITDYIWDFDRSLDRIDISSTGLSRAQMEQLIAGETLSSKAHGSIYAATYFDDDNVRIEISSEHKTLVSIFLEEGFPESLVTADMFIYGAGLELEEDPALASSNNEDPIESQVIHLDPDIYNIVRLNSDVTNIVTVPDGGGTEIQASIHDFDPETDLIDISAYDITREQLEEIFNGGEIWQGSGQWRRQVIHAGDVDDVVEWATNTSRIWIPNILDILIHYIEGYSHFISTENFILGANIETSSTVGSARSYEDLNRLDNFIDSVNGQFVL